MTKEEKKAIEYASSVIMLYDMGIQGLTYTQGENDTFKTLLNLIEKQQKEIEEYKGIARKKVIEKDEIIDDLSILNEKYKKLQEEIEEKNKKEKNFLLHYKSNSEVEGNYIPKEKIREKIDTFFDNLIYAKDKDELKEALKEELLEEG